MDPSSTDLSESVFFTARKARLPFHTHESAGAASSSDPASAPLSSLYYSARIHTLMERKSELGMSQEDREIEASRVHWTEMEPEYYTSATSASGSESVRCFEELTEADKVKLYEENVEVMRSLQSNNPESRFFEIGDGEVVLGRKIAEGGQATIYDGGSKVYVYRDGDESPVLPIVMKVFKAGYSLRDLQKCNPLVSEGGWFNPVVCGRLLGDGRFAFEMLRFWGDLRKLLDVRMQHTGNRHPPLMMPDGNYYEFCTLRMMLDIANGMRDLHGEGTLHRDLKASNVLVESRKWSLEEGQLEENPLDPLELEHDIASLVSDYECSVGVVGTGFWRGPEILKASKDRALYTTANLFTPKTHVYSYAMTCYEILTGFVPFEDPEDRGTSNEDVIQGKRPTSAPDCRLQCPSKAILPFKIYLCGNCPSQ